MLVKTQKNGLGEAAFRPGTVIPIDTSFPYALEGGLAISRSIILAHKGRPWATNRSDRGAAFNFTLPVTAREGDS